jgi:ADP-ribose pyrophosphatase YjhB (NUDIX family)
VKAIRREYEETGLRVEIGSLLGVLDRRDKDSITLLFAAVPNKSSIMFYTAGWKKTYFSAIHRAMAQMSWKFSSVAAT